MSAVARIEHEFAPLGRPRHAPQSLTVRESQCLSALAFGERTQRIAATLGIAPITVDFHIRNARRKLGAKTREHAVAIALINGLLTR